MQKTFNHIDDDRIEFIDALRGFALLGLFLVHCAEVFELYWSNPIPSPVHDWIFIIFSGKSFALFALCFGLSFSIIMDRAAKRGQPNDLRFAWRLIILLFFGLAHSLIYRGDILVPLALLGFLLLPLNKIRKKRWLAIIAIIFILNPFHLWRIYAALNGSEWAMAIPNHYGGSFDAYMNGRFLSTVAENFGPGNIMKWWFYYESGRLSQIMGLFVLGMLLGRIDFFRSMNKRVNLILCACIITSILSWLLYNWRADILTLLPQKDGDFTAAYIGLLMKNWADLMFMAAQMLGLILLWIWGGYKIISLLAPAGRMTLSLYIGQSLVFVPLLYDFGLGLHDDLNQIQLFYIGVFGFILQMIAAKIWMKKFYYGPIEWLWRIMTKWDFQIPLRRSYKV